MYTGNIKKLFYYYILESVYPCVYREHTIFSAFDVISSGLSLCIQGTSHGEGGYYLFCRFIPVYTGNIRQFHILLLLSAVYPCVYREHADGAEHRYFIGGLSLCIQGTCPQNLVVYRGCRFIPVYTGNIRMVSG